MNKVSKLLMAVCAGMALSSAAMADDFTDFTEFNGVHLEKCSIDNTEGALNFCTTDMTNKMKAQAKKDTIFGENSVLMRFWDSKMDYRVYGVINKDTNKVFFYPRGLRQAEGDHRKVKVTFDDKNSICTAGDNVEAVGDDVIKSFTDLEAELDYCTPYSDTEGFGDTFIVDAETREFSGTVG